MRCLHVNIKELLNEISFEGIRFHILMFLWRIRAKKFETVNDINISYLEVSPILLRDDPLHSKYSRGMFFRNTINGSIKIFTAGPDNFHRYTIYHEYCEAKLLEKNSNTEQVSEIVFSEMRLIQKIFETPEDISDLQKMAIQEIIKKESAHIGALFEELSLARKELPINTFKEYATRRLKQAC